MKRPTTALTVVLIAGLLAGCSVVKVSEAGKRVNMISSDQAYNCTRVGSISTSVLEKIVGVPRADTKIETELDRLARDQAVLMNANSLHRVSIQGAEGSYIAYNCP